MVSSSAYCATLRWRLVLASLPRYGQQLEDSITLSMRYVQTSGRNQWYNHRSTTLINIQYAERLIAGLEFLGRLDQHRGLAHIGDDGRILLR